MITFGLSDRYTWLEEDFPRDDCAPRRPLPFDERMRPKPAYDAQKSALEQARRVIPCGNRLGPEAAPDSSPCLDQRRIVGFRRNRP